MDFVGRAVAVATVDKKLKGSVAKVEEGRLHVTLRNGKNAVVSAEEIVDLQVLTEPPSESSRSSSNSPAATKQPNNKTRSKKSAPKQGQASQSKLGGSAVPAEKKPQPQPQPQPQAQPRQPKESWDTANDEFDFEASHRQFDKKAVFQSIKETAAPVPNGQRTVYRVDEMVIPTTPRGSRNDAQAQAMTGPNGPLEYKMPVKSTNATSALPTATALQKVQVQSYMLGQGWSSNAVDECASRGIAGVCLRNLAHHNSLDSTTVVILAGNHTSGARALAAGRILATRGVFVVAVLVDQTPDQLECQLPAFKASGCMVVNTQKALFAALEKASPVAMVLDALQGFERISLEDQITQPEQLAASRWLVGWANSQNAVRVALERVSTHGDLALQATVLVNCGWPLPTASNTSPIRAPAQYVVDLCVPKQVLQKLGLSQLFINFGNRLYINVEN